MELLHGLYLACLGGMGTGIVVSVILFFWLDIRTVWRVLAGAPVRVKERAKAKAPRRRRNRRKADQGTVILDTGQQIFYVEREVMVIHTEQTEVCRT